jgi:AcrR family transcriptional regulator
MYATDVPDTEDLRRLGDALEAAMRYRNATPANVAAGVGVSRDTVYRWMGGKHGMALAEAARLAEILDAPSDLFIRPPGSWGAAMAMMGAWDEVRGRPAGPSPDPSRP